MKDSERLTGAQLFLFWLVAGLACIAIWFLVILGAAWLMMT